MGSPSHPPDRPPSGGRPSAPVDSPVWRLRWRGRTIVLGEEPTLIGRSSQCQVQVDDPLVSRRHASLQVSGDALFLEDLRSANGVFVNGERVRRPRRLLDGDRILVGNDELIVVKAGVSSAASDQAGEFEDEPRTLDPEARSDVHDVVPDWPRASRGSYPTVSSVTTEKAEAFTMLGRLADRLISEGRPERAAHVLADILREVLDAARTGFDISEEAYEQACRYAMKLAEATLDGRWVDYQVELHLALREPLPRASIRAIEALAARGVALDLAIFQRYQDQVRELRTVAKPAERALCDLSLQFDPRAHPRS